MFPIRRAQIKKKQNILKENKKTSGLSYYLNGLNVNDSYLYDFSEILSLLELTPVMKKLEHFIV